MNVLIVGQAPSRDHDALTGRSGRRVAALCGLHMADFLARFERTNLVAGYPGSKGHGDAVPPAAECKRLAARLSPRVEGRRVVLLGRLAAVAFELDAVPLRFTPHRGGVFAWCPHPSGVNRWWNEPANVRRASRFWRALAQRPEAADVLGVVEPRRVADG